MLWCYNTITGKHSFLCPSSDEQHPREGPWLQHRPSVLVICLLPIFPLCLALTFRCHTSTHIYNASSEAKTSDQSYCLCVTSTLQYAKRLYWLKKPHTNRQQESIVQHATHPGMCKANQYHLLQKTSCMVSLKPTWQCY